MRSHSCGDGKLALLGGSGFLGTTDGLLLGLEGSELSAECAILLLAEIVRRVSLLLELGASGVNSLLGKDGEDLGDVLPDRSDLGELDLLLGDLGHAKSGELLTVGGEFFDQFGLLVLSNLMAAYLVHCNCFCL